VPIYEYRCPNGHTFEVFQKMADAPAEVCAICSAGPVEKILFPVAVHFKGSGFYSTDYGRGGRKDRDGDGDAPATDKAKDKPAEKASATDKKATPPTSD
jgi:putative FmdB family regulatory protein